MRPGDGVGPVRLGMRPGQVEGLLGPPLGHDAWDDGNLNDSLIYDGLRLTFDRCDSQGPLTRSRLVVIEVRRPDAVLLGRTLAGWEQGELATRLMALGLRPKRSAVGYAEFDSPWAALWFGTSGRLTGIEIA